MFRSQYASYPKIKHVIRIPYINRDRSWNIGSQLLETMEIQTSTVTKNKAPGFVGEAWKPTSRIMRPGYKLLMDILEYTL